MEHSADGAPPLVAAPRHLRRRRLREEIPDTLLVPGAEPAIPGPVRDAGASRAAASNRPSPPKAKTRKAMTPAKRKRAVAFVAVFFVSLSIPVLVLALILAR